MNPVVKLVPGEMMNAAMERHGVLIQEWDRVRTDWLTIQGGAEQPLQPAA